MGRGFQWAKYSMNLEVNFNGFCSQHCTVPMPLTDLQLWGFVLWTIINSSGDMALKWEGKSRNPWKPPWAAAQSWCLPYTANLGGVKGRELGWGRISEFLCLGARSPRGWPSSERTLKSRAELSCWHLLSCCFARLRQGWNLMQVPSLTAECCSLIIWWEPLLQFWCVDIRELLISDLFHSARMVLEAISCTWGMIDCSAPSQLLCGFNF